MIIPKSGILKPWLLVELDYILMKNDKALLWAGASALGFDLTLSGTWSDTEHHKYSDHVMFKMQTHLP